MTTLELPPDRALRKSCGACVRCVDVCPTRALRGDYTIDANRCISDLTQRRGAIPLQLRALIGDWVWGCDLCQLVCPPTRRAGPGASEAFAARDTDAAQPQLVELLQLDGATFDARFRSTAMGWRGAAVLRRNAAVALGNSLDRAAVEPLIGSLQRDRNRLVRGHAAWALGRIGSPRAVSALLRRADVERDGYVKNEITMALQPSGRRLARTVRHDREIRRCRTRRAVALRRRAGARAIAERRAARSHGGAQPDSACLHRNDARARRDGVVSVPFRRSRGHLYFKAPDRNKVVFTSGVPVVASQFDKLYAHVEPPAAWRRLYDIVLVGNDGATATFHLIPRKQGNVERIDVTADDRTATVTAMRWNYRNGGYAEMTDKYASQNGNLLVVAQTGHISEPGYIADVTLTIDAYKINPAIPDGVFAGQ